MTFELLMLLPVLLLFGIPIAAITLIAFSAFAWRRPALAFSIAFFIAGVFYIMLLNFAR